MKSFIALAALFALFSCNSSDEKSVTNSGNDQQEKPVSTVDPTSGSNMTAPVPAAIVDFDMFVYGLDNGNKLCSGQAVITVNSDFSIKFPSSKLSCASIVLDLGKLLEGQTGGSNTMSHLSHDGFILYADKLENATFQPPRPFMIGPIITDRSKYEGYTKSVTSQVNAVSIETSKQYDLKGTVTLSVLDFNNYTNPVVQDTFSSVIHWQATTTGFDSMPKTLGLLFEKMEWWFNTSPIMIPQIEIVADLNDFLDNKGTTQGQMSELLGKVRIVLQANNYKIQ